MVLFEKFLVHLATKQIPNLLNAQAGALSLPEKWGGCYKPSERLMMLQVRAFSMNDFKLKYLWCSLWTTQNWTICGASSG
jgi:hypothetical protein